MPNSVELSPPPSFIESGLSSEWLRWFETIFERIGNGPFKVRGYEVAALPSASDWASNNTTNLFSSIIYVTDESGGSTLAFSDGTNWRRVWDLAVVS